MSRSIHAAQGESLPYNHYLHQFLTFLKHERGFADATIVNRERSLKPFLGWLVAEDVPLSTLSPVVITKYFTGIVAGRWKRTTVSFHVQSLRSFFRYASSRGWCAAGIAESIDAPPGLRVRKSAARAGVGRREEAFHQRQRHVASSDQKSLRDPALLGLRPARWRSLLPAS
jgi:site-specific recombinase XerD